ncbi:hypothetical protein [Niabella ginsengisoli]|uniref:DUF4178 domain-containing protein n=1 Tax=Niabella ginsengisoli TaxID=522298 RepID=A0ABS9SR86_9BACT|nr:hypothetical protein [Niabella ginsengisoli]MCH5600908.1 hypothetical protein [Niabella ginsengisoli]
MPFQVGKSITYRLDSTVFVLSGTVEEIHKYQVKHTVLQETDNNNGSKTFVVQRLINNETATGPWLNNGTYQVVLFDNKAEVINDNLRVLALQAPLKQGFSWKGNSQLPSAPYAQLYDMAAGREMNEWDFTYTTSGNENIEGQEYQNVWTVEHHDETLNIPPTPNTSYGSKEVSSERYAKGIGLVYKDFQLYEYQGGNQESGYKPYYTGFGITMWMIAHD